MKANNITQRKVFRASLYILCGMNEHFPGWVHVLSPAMFYPYARKRHACDPSPLDLRVPRQGSREPGHTPPSYFSWQNTFVLQKLWNAWVFSWELPHLWSFSWSHLEPEKLCSSQCSAFALGMISLEPLGKVLSTSTMAESLETQACVQMPVFMWVYNIIVREMSAMTNDRTFTYLLRQERGGVWLSRHRTMTYFMMVRLLVIWLRRVEAWYSALFPSPAIRPGNLPDRTVSYCIVKVQYRFVDHIHLPLLIS